MPEIPEHRSLIGQTTSNDGKEPDRQSLQDHPVQLPRSLGPIENFPSHNRDQIAHAYYLRKDSGTSYFYKPVMEDVPDQYDS
jgi:hypothetical protein